MIKKSGLNLVLLSFLFITSFAVLISAADSSSILSEAVPWSNTFLTQIFLLGETWEEFIIGVIILLIIISSVYNILDITTLFGSAAVKVIISGGLGIVFAISGMVRGAATGMIKFAAALGAGVIWVEIIMSLLIFLGLSLGVFPWLSEWAAKRKTDATKVAAIKGAGKMRAGARTLSEIGEEAERSGRR
jgi:hypothetical protein